MSLGRNQGVDRAVLTPGLWGTILFASSSFWWLPVFLDLWPHHSNPFLVVTGPPPLCVCEISLCFRQIWVRRNPQEVCKDTCGHVRPTQIIQDNLPISTFSLNHQSLCHIR